MWSFAEFQQRGMFRVNSMFWQASAVASLISMLLKHAIVLCLSDVAITASKEIKINMILP